MTYYFETYGCQMNIAESNAVVRLFHVRGWQAAESADAADVVVINTCSVRQTAENRVYGRLGYYSGLKSKHKFTLVVMGCMAQRMAEQLQKDYPAIDYVVGNLPGTLPISKNDVGRIIDAVERGQSVHEVNTCMCATSYQFAPLSLSPSLLTASSYVPIMHGCNNFCTYCIVPYLRGREVSRPVEAIIDEVDELSSFGVKEITLLGQNVNSYHSADVGFAELLRLIDAHLDEVHSPIEWVRFISSHPKDLTDDVIKAIAGSAHVCHHIHLPVQHASDRILQAMNRHYTKADYMALVGRIRDAVADVSLTTDIMVGFPGECNDDFEAVLRLMDEVRYENAFMYYYNVREGTPAAQMDNQIPLEMKKARLQQVIDKQLNITAQVMAARAGGNASVKALVEGVSRDDSSELIARTEQDERVVFVGGTNLIGKFVNVRLTSLNGHTFKGELNTSAL